MVFARLSLGKRFPLGIAIVFLVCCFQLLSTNVACIQAMPHLAEMQQQYADKGVQLISVSSEDLTTVENFLDRKIRGGSDDGPKTFGELTSTYCLTCDPDGSVRNDYLQASGQKGIPCAFLLPKPN